MPQVFPKDMSEKLGDACTLVVRNGARTQCYARRGVADIYALLRDEPDFLRGALVADKVVGKAAAAAMIEGGVARVYARTVSTGALALFRAAGVDVAYGEKTPHIINRSKTGLCPMEQLSGRARKPAVIVARVRQFLETRNP